VEKLAFNLQNNPMVDINELGNLADQQVHLAPALIKICDIDSLPILLQSNWTV
jgi:hypothetical protein